MNINFSDDNLPHPSKFENASQIPETHGYSLQKLKKNITTSLRERWKRYKISYDIPNDEQRKTGTSVYFKDGQRLIDYVLVYDSDLISETRDIFLDSIIEIGLEIEETESVIDSNIKFVKIHGPKTILQKFAEKFDIPIKKLQTSYIRPPIPKFAFLRTELTRQDPSSPNFHRAPETFSGNMPKKFLTCERSLIVFNILKRIEYGPNIYDNGIERLIDDVNFCAAFPLHDGTFKWDDHPDKPLNDRQGKSYTHPNDPDMYAKSSDFLMDICDPSGCFSEVHTQLAIIMLLLPTFSNIIRYAKSSMTIWIRRKKLRNLKLSHRYIPRWEKDYELNNLTSEELLMMYEEMVIQFGFLTLFTFAFPFAPFIAWINSLVKTQLDANILVTECRRPNPKRSATIGAWMDIMKFLTYLSVFFNACYITFTSDFLHKQVYKYTKDVSTLEGYVQYSLSSYYINLDHWPSAGMPNGTECWYPGYRYGPDTEYPFEYKFEYYQLLAFKLMFIIIFEHVILGLTAFISYSLPDVPQEVKHITALRTMRLRKFLEKDASFTSVSIIRMDQTFQIPDLMKMTKKKNK